LGELPFRLDCGDDTEARIEPFDVVPLDVADWWPPMPAG
jgi:hypothetical protein